MLNGSYSVFGDEIQDLGSPAFDPALNGSTLVQAATTIPREPVQEEASDYSTSKLKTKQGSGRNRKPKGNNFTTHASMKKALSDEEYYVQLKVECSKLKTKIENEEKMLARIPEDEVEQLKNVNERIRRAHIKIEAIENELKLKDLKEELDLLLNQNTHLFDENTYLKARLSQYESCKRPKTQTIEEKKESIIIRFGTRR